MTQRDDLPDPSLTPIPMNPELLEEFITLREREGLCGPRTHRFGGISIRLGERATCQCRALRITLTEHGVTATVQTTGFDVDLGPLRLSL